MIGTASTLIPPPRNRKKLEKETYKTKDIVSVVQRVIRTNVADTAAFAKGFTPDRKGLKKLFDWVNRHITYEEDPPGSQWVQTPAWLNKSRKGDCKSITALISTTLSNMGVEHLIRYSAYSAGELRHVYPVAILGGREIPLDVVWKKQEGGHFGAEKPYHHKKDFRVKGLYQLGSTRISGREYIGKMETELRDIEQAAASIPDLVEKGWGDVTRMTKGELDRMIFADRYAIQAKQTKDRTAQRRYLDAARAMKNGSISGIGTVKGQDPLGMEVRNVLRSAAAKRGPAFQKVTLNLPPIPRFDPSVDGFWKNVWNGAKKIVKKVGEAFSVLFKKFVNWMFKGAAKLIGPFFIFKFLKRDKIRSPKIKARMKSQDSTYNFIQRVGKFDDKQLKGIMLNGILENTGKSPQQMAAEAGVAKIGAAPIIPVIIKAIGWVVQVVEKVASLFKKNRGEGGVVDQTTMSDPRLFEEEARLQAQTAGSGGGSKTLLLAAAAGIPLILNSLK